MTNEEYINKSGMICPLCGMRDSLRSTSSIDQDGTTLYQDVKCDSCNRSYVDIYALSGFHYDPNCDVE